ncbi:MAG TPA: ammonium transporter [Burkholderiales bacterium]|nr:ammonium transporter [Burkholderiales bacterium]
MIRKLFLLLALVSTFGLGTATPVLAQDAATDAYVAIEEAAEEEAALDTGDTAWMLISTVLVVVMCIPGLALFYGGMVRAKNMLSVLMQVFVTFSLMSVLWALVGYSLAFTDGGSLNGFIGGLGSAFLSGITADSLSGTIPEYLFAVFQLTFAALTPALIVGAFAERMKFSAVLWFMTLWLFVCYVPMAHMVWGGGWIGAMGAIDFAGGTVVHMNAGVAGLIAAIVIGKRKGHGTVAMPPHNLTFTLIGAALLWAGWFGFNAGSALAANGGTALAMINTQLATAAAVLAWTFIEWMVKGKPSLLGAASGAIAGLVAITPACGHAGPMGAILLGLIAGVVAFWACAYLKKALGYDDALDVFGVHGVAGIVGAVLIGVLASESFGGAGYAEGVTMGGQLMTQIISVVFTFVYVSIATYILLKIVDMIVGLRVSEDVETEGLDVPEHGEMAYHP